MRRSARQRVRNGRAVRLSVAASEPATVRVALRIPGVTTLRSASRALQAGVRGTFRLSVRGARGKQVRAAVARRSRLARLTITARDAAGNESRVVRRVRLR